MYESEVDGRKAAISKIPSDVRRRFAELTDRVIARTVLPWGEHCTECAIPTCYATCALYSERPDGKCRRFTGGTGRIDGIEGVGAYLLEVSFRRWGQLHAVGHTYVTAVEEAKWIERRDLLSGSVLRSLPLPRAVRRWATRRRSRGKNDAARALAGSGGRPSYFLLEVYNPGGERLRLTFTVRPKTERAATPFQERLSIEPGFTRHRVDVASIAARVDLDAPFVVDLMPNEVPEGTTLYFGGMDFVVDPGYRRPTARTCKCVVWDLDNTVWDGILVEDGLDALQLRPGVAEVFRTLDARGILHSVVSKNDPDRAMRALRRFGLDDYVLAPQISWDPKGAMVGRVAKALNIGRDTLIFVDDSPFERAEVASVCPDVLVLDAEDVPTLPERPECRVPVTEDSRRRRSLYREQAVRDEAKSGFDGDYLAFLRECEMELVLSPLGPENIERVYELTQRTNQMNFSGRRYTPEELDVLGRSEDHDTYVMRCRDRFGDYGIVGFACVERNEPRLLDLTFSCRVQSKRVEHAFLTTALRRYLPGSNDGFFVTYRRTDRNAPSGRVFDDFQMERVDVGTDGAETLRFPSSRPVPDDALVSVVEAREAVS